MNDAASWRTSALGDLVEDTIGGLWGNSFTGQQKPDEVDVIVVRGADFRNWDTRRALDAVPRRIPVRSLERRRLQPGDLVIEVSGGSPAQPVGRVLVIDERAVAEASKPLVCSNFCRKLRLKPGVDPYFVKAQLDWLYQSGHTDQFQTSTTNIRNLQVDDFLRGTELLLPDLALQARLATLIASVEAMRRGSEDHLRAARRAIDGFRKALIIGACSGRITAEWRHGRGSEEAMFPTLAQSTQPLAEVPSAWAWARLGDIADVRGGVQKGAKLKSGEPTREVPYLRVANVQRGWLDLSEIKVIAAPESKITDLRLQPGDILFNEGGDRDKLGRGWIWEGQIDECIHQNHVFRARLRQPGMQPKFFSWYGNSIGATYFLDQGKQTVNLASLSMSKLRALPVPIPSIDEQAEIVRRVDELLGLADRLRARIETSTTRVARSAQAVLASAFRGNLVSDSLEDSRPLAAAQS